MKTKIFEKLQKKFQQNQAYSVSDHANKITKKIKKQKNQKYKCLGMNIMSIGTVKMIG